MGQTMPAARENIPFHRSRRRERIEQGRNSYYHSSGVRTWSRERYSQDEPWRWQKCRCDNDHYSFHGTRDGRFPPGALNMRLRTERTTGAHLSMKALGVTFKACKEEGEENKLFIGLLPATKFGLVLRQCLCDRAGKS